MEITNGQQLWDTDTPPDIDTQMTVQNGTGVSLVSLTACDRRTKQIVIVIVVVVGVVDFLHIFFLSFWKTKKKNKKEEEYAPRAIGLTPRGLDNARSLPIRPFNCHQSQTIRCPILRPGRNGINIRVRGICIITRTRLTTTFGFGVYIFIRACFSVSNRQLIDCNLLGRLEHVVGLNFFYWALLLNMDFNCVVRRVSGLRDRF